MLGLEKPSQEGHALGLHKVRRIHKPEIKFQSWVTGGLPCTRLYLVRSEPDKIQVARAPKIRIQIRRWLTTLPQLHRFRGSDSKEAPLAPLRNIQNPDFRFQIPDSRFRGSRYQIPDSRVREEHRPDIHRNQDSDSNSALEPSRRSDAQKSDTTVAKGAQTAQGSMA